LSDGRVKTQVYFSLFETVLRECLTFMFVSPLMLIWSLIVVKIVTYLVESANKNGQ